MRRWLLVLALALALPGLAGAEGIQYYPPSYPGVWYLGDDSRRGISFTLPISTPTSSTLLTDLVAYWTLDEATGNRVTSAGSCTSCTVAPTGAVGQTTGKLGDGAAQFTANGQYLSAGYDSSQQMGTSVSVAAWINRHTNSGSYKPVFRIGEAAYAGEFFSVGDAFGVDASYVFCSFGSSSGAVALTGVTTLTLDQWTFVQCYVDEVDQKVHMRLNGGSWTESAAVASGALGPQSLGAICIDADGNTCSDTGNVAVDIDAVGYWNRVLTPTEWDALYASGAGVEYPWSSIVSAEPPNYGAWASLSVSEKQAAILSATGVLVPKELFPGGVAAGESSTLNNDLTAYWALEEESGTRPKVAGSCDSCDLSPGSGDAQMPARVASKEAAAGYGVLLDSTHGQYLGVADSAYLSGGTAKSFAIAGWTYQTALSGATVFSKEAVGDYEYRLFDTSSVYPAFSFTVDPSGDGSAQATVSAPYGSFTPCQWKFFYAFHDATNNVIGVSGNAGDEYVSSYSGDVHNGAGAFTVGGRVGGASGMLSGGVDALRFYSRRLTSSEVRALFYVNAGAPGYSAEDPQMCPDDSSEYVVADGDSKTAGVGGFWTTTFEVGMAAAEHPITVDNLSASLMTAASRRSRITADLASFARRVNVSYVLINLGANDVSVSLNETVWKDNMGTLMDAYHAKWSSAQVYVMRPWRRGKATECNTLAGWIADLVSARSPWAHLGPDERVFLENGDDGATYTDDGIHPNAAGYALTAAEWMAAIGVGE